MKDAVCPLFRVDAFCELSVDNWRTIIAFWENVVHYHLSAFIRDKYATSSIWMVMKADYHAYKWLCLGILMSVLRELC